MAESSSANTSAVKQLYETGMRISFDVRSGRVVVRFRGRLTALPGVFATEGHAVEAGEAFCRQRGWRPVPLRPAPEVAVRTAW